MGCARNSRRPGGIRESDCSRRVGTEPSRGRRRCRQRSPTLTKEINAEQSRLELQAKETYLAAKATEDKIEQELDAKKKDAYDQGNDLVE